ncbi:hypothetical protein KUCAC02_036447 [Chaenocephalus aceratus]|nr:hypothetical protein KUCAC02_036447 [Chaenocephalus aceratus]
MEVRRLLRGAMASLGRRLDSLERKRRRSLRREEEEPLHVDLPPQGPPCVAPPPQESPHVAPPPQGFLV